MLKAVCQSFVCQCISLDSLFTCESLSVQSYVRRTIWSIFVWLKYTEQNNINCWKVEMISSEFVFFNIFFTITGCYCNLYKLVWKLVLMCNFRSYLNGKPYSTNKGYVFSKWRYSTVIYCGCYSREAIDIRLRRNHHIQSLDHSERWTPKFKQFFLIEHNVLMRKFCFAH